MPSDTMSVKKWFSAIRSLGWSHPVNVEGRRNLFLAVLSLVLAMVGSKTGNEAWHAASCGVFLSWYLTKGPAYEMGRLMGRLDAEIEMAEKGDGK